MKRRATAQKRGSRFVQLGLIAGAALASVGCSKAVLDPIAPLEQVAGAAPDRSAGPLATTRSFGEPDQSGREWWQAYGHPVLDQLIGEARSGNFSLRDMQARIEAARAQARVVGAARLPRVTLDGKLGYTRSISAFGAFSTLNTDAELAVAYEVNLLGAEAKRYKGARADARASRHQRTAAQLTTEIDVAEAYFALLASGQRERVLSRQVEVNEDLLDNIQRRFEAGVTPISSLHQQRQQLAVTRSRLQQARAQAVPSRQRLAILLGEAHEPLRLESLPSLPEPRPIVDRTRVFAQVDQRPDVQEASARLAAARHRESAAKADLAPSLRLQATPGYTWQRNWVADQAGQNAHGPLVAAGANVRVPIFEGGAKRAQRNQARAMSAASYHALAGVRHRAKMETEYSLELEELRRRELETLRVRLASARASLEAARAEYEVGRTDYVRVLTALDAWQNAELEELTAQHQLMASRLQVHRGVGGSIRGAGVVDRMKDK